MKLKYHIISDVICLLIVTTLSVIWLYRNWHDSLITHIWIFGWLAGVSIGWISLSLIHRCYVDLLNQQVVLQNRIIERKQAFIDKWYSVVGLKEDDTHDD